jgi:hypothetical protein
MVNILYFDNFIHKDILLLISEKRAYTNAYDTI